MSRPAPVEPPLVAPRDARRLLLEGLGLLDRDDVRATPATVLRRIERLGFVQVDTISVFDRAHDHVLRTRLAGYRPEHLDRLQRSGRIFEHWTHDASIIPTASFRHWRPRFERYRGRDRSGNAWWRERLGPEPERLLAAVRARIEREGPLRSADFEHEVPRAERPEGGAWWGWKPQKAALEHLWRSGELLIRHREGFQKVYDLAERVLPEALAEPPPDAAEHRNWACGEALRRLGVATPAELAQFFRSIPIAEAGLWCREAVARGDAVAVRIGDVAGGRPRAGVARPDWKRRAARCPDPPAAPRLLSPFDPLVRDRTRVSRLFGFDYRFEAFVPAAKRRHGYFVLPVLEGDRLVARIDPKLRRDAGVLEVRGPWWEPDVRATPARRRALDAALERTAALLGATRVERIPT